MTPPLDLSHANLVKELPLDLKPSVIVLVISAAFTSMLFPLLFALVYFSTAKIRRTPTYVSVFITVLAGIGVGSWGAYNSIHGILSPWSGISTSMYIAYGIAIGFVGLLVDIVLLFRVVAVFPTASTPLAHRTLILAPAVFLKLVRVAGWVWFGLQFAHDAGDKAHLSDLGFAATDPDSRSLFANYLTHLIAVTLDNMYASVMFMLKIASQRRTWNGIGVSDSWGSKLRTLFWLAATNFVFPVILNFVQLGLRLSGLGADFFILIANTQISIICAVFATVWASDDASRSSQIYEDPLVLDGKFIEPIRFARGSISSGASSIFEPSAIHTQQDILRADGTWEHSM